MKIIIVRHGNNFNKGDTILRIGCQTDLDLTERGKEQGHEVGEYLKKNNLIPDIIFMGPLKRHLQMTEKIKSIIGKNIPEQLVNDLNEVDYGNDDGKPEEEIIARIGKEALHLWNTQNIIPEGWPIDINTIQTFWKDFIPTIAQNHTCATIVTSNGIAKFVLNLISPKTRGNISPKLKTGHIGIIDISANGDIKIIGWNINPN